MKYTQTAVGSFSIGVVPGTNHCGPNSTRCEMSYSVDIKWNDSPLDSRGFLLDNLWFGRFFNDFYHCRLKISCEQFAGEIAKQILSLTDRRANEVCVTLQAISGVFVKCEISQADIIQPAIPEVSHEWAISPALMAVERYS